jgi:hypothetical protein
MTVTIDGTAGITFPNSSTQSVGFYGFKNRIINGAMNISQGANGASVTPTVAGSYATNYAVDRFNTFATVASKYTIQQTPSATETGYATRVGAGFKNYLAVTSSSAYSVASGDYFLISQSIEGFNTADLVFGTSSAKTITLSFWAYSSLTGTFGGSLCNSALSRSYPFSYSIPVANTWTQISITIAGDTSGTWVGATNGAGLIVFFNLGSGTSQSTTAGAWASGFYSAPTGAVSVVGTNGATFYVTGVQLEVGTQATSFDYRPYGTELALCQRYYQQITYAGSTISYLIGTAYDSANIYNMNVYSLPVTMRSAPTFSTAGTFLLADGLGNNPAVTTLTLSSMSMANSFTANIVSSGLTTGRTYYLISTASSALKISAEL